MDPKVAARMRAHVTLLASEHAICLHWVSHWKYAQAVEQIAFVPEIRHPYDYLFALHELGHCASPHALALDDDMDSYSEVLVEGAAWAWAVAAAKPSLARHLRAKDWDTVAFAYRTYLAHHARSTDPSLPTRLSLAP